MVSLWGHFVGLPVRRSVQLPWRSPRVRSCLSIQGIWIRPVRKSSLLGALLRVILKIYSKVVQSRKFLRDSISPYSYSWSFDDGQSSAVSSPVHTYSLPRFYSANVTVTDAGGRSVSQTVGITVLAQPPIQNGSLLSTYLSYGLAGSLVALGLMVVLYLRRDAQLKHGSSGDATRATSGNP